MSWGWLTGAEPPGQCGTSYVTPEAAKALEDETPTQEGWERSPVRDDETARRVRRMFGWPDDV